MSLLILYFIISIVFSFLCSIWEAVLLSVTPTYVNRLNKEGSSTGKLFSEYKEDIDRPLSAILTLNTIAHTFGAMGVGAQAGKIYGTKSIDFLGLELSYESLIAGLMTLAILFLSEIIPKTIGANNWKSLAGFTARSIQILLWILAPFVWMSQKITKFLKKNKNESVLSRSDFQAMAEAVEESGELQQSEYKIIKNLLNFEELTAKDIMTPRTVMQIANQDTTVMDFYQSKNKKLPFSRIPLYDQTPDQITGILLKDDLLQTLVEDRDSVKLYEIMREVTMVNDDLPLPALFERLVTKNRHMVIVVDDFGMVLGLVTMEDLIETLFGQEIIDESDSVGDLQEYARKKWNERATKMGLIQEDGTVNSEQAEN